MPKITKQLNPGDEKRTITSVIETPAGSPARDSAGEIDTRLARWESTLEILDDRLLEVVDRIQRDLTTGGRSTVDLRRELPRGLWLVFLHRHRSTRFRPGCEAEGRWMRSIGRRQLVLLELVLDGGVEMLEFTVGGENIGGCLRDSLERDLPAAVAAWLLDELAASPDDIAEMLARRMSI